MEKDIALGSVGGVKLSLAGGKAMISISASESVLGGAVVVQAASSGMVDAAAFVDMLFAEIEEKIPGAKPLEESVKAVIKDAVLAIQ